MKHLILQDNKLTYMVYFRPKDKVKMYEILIEAQKKFWKDELDMELIDYTKSLLNSNGFKVVDISDEIKDKLSLRTDFSDDYFTYKGIRVYISRYGLHYRYQGRLTACKTIEEAIKMIDKEVE